MVPNAYDDQAGLQSFVHLQHDDIYMHRSRLLQDYRGNMEIGGKSVWVSEDCYMSDWAAVQDELSNSELIRKAFRQAEQGVQRGHRERLLHLGGSMNTKSKDISALRKSSQDTMAKFAAWWMDVSANERSLTSTLCWMSCMSLRQFQAELIIHIQSSM